MKRSEINRIVMNAEAFFAEHGLLLPPFAHWTLADWREQAARARGIVGCRLGWDVTDFGRGRFERRGLVLFTLRNGLPQGMQAERGALYAEKAMVVHVDQLTPMHRHLSKTEDIINRRGGRLAIELGPTEPADGSRGDVVRFVVDGLLREARAGYVLKLEPGQSVTITPDLYHSFWAVGEPVLVGEVSTVNDDERDNRFLEDMPRFPSIEEDEPPVRLLVSDYQQRL